MCEVSHFANRVIRKEFNDIMYLIKYYITTPNYRWFLKPNRIWDRKDKIFKFIVLDKADETFMLYLDTRCSTTGCSIFLEGAPVLCISQDQKYYILSVTEVLLIVAVAVVQHMLYTKNLLNSFKLEIKLLMNIEIDNKGFIDLINNWSVSRRTYYINIKKNFLHELKEDGIIHPVQKTRQNNSSDLFTKNLHRPDFKWHTKEYARYNEYM